METGPEIVLDGDWVAPLRPNRTWHGVIKVPEPLVVLVAGVSPGRVLWAKTRARSSESELSASFYVHDLDHAGSRAQLSLRVGDGWIQDLAVEVDQPDFLPNNSMPMKLRFGVFHEIFQVRGMPPTSMRLLLLPRSSVKMGRGGIWRVRERHMSEVPPELASVVMEGRTGDFRPSAG